MKNEKVWFYNQNKEKLTGNLYQPNAVQKRGVIFAHCFTCSRHTRILLDCCQSLYEEGFTALRFDFSGNGQSEGQFSGTTYTKHIGELLSAITYLKQKGVSQVGLVGHSMGAAISLMAASRRPDIAAVCTLAGRYSNLHINNLIDSAKQQELETTGKISFSSRNRQLSLSHHFFDDLEHHNLPETVRQLTQPLLAIHGEKDEIIPVEEVYHSLKLKPTNTEIFVIKNADHMFSDESDRKTIASHLVHWFNHQLPSHPF